MFKKIKNLFKVQQDYDGQLATKAIEVKEKDISTNLDETIETFKTCYSFPNNKDVKIRDITIGGLNKKASLLYISTITNTDLIEDHVIVPLLLNNESSKVMEDIITSQSITRRKKIKDILKDINKGNAALFIDDNPNAYLISCSNFQGRGIEAAQNEVVLKGPKESFNEKAVTNISLIRKKIKSEDLVFESTVISERSNNELFIAYIKDVADDKLIHNIRQRVNELDPAAIQNLGLLEQYIEERSKSLFPTVLYTERPDRAASYLEDGYIVLIMDNSPACLILPATFWSFYHSPEDHYLRFPYGNFTRFLRISSIFITLFASAIYVGVTNYHVEMVPIDLLLAIASTREKVPFPAFVEVLLMELSFELIREAGLRVPNPIGPTIGIVGALILGQAAVQANIVSPIVVIVVALGGVSSFAVGDISLNFTIRLLKLTFIISAGVMGIFGMTAIFAVGLFYIVSIKSFGVPYLAPLTPKYISSKNTIFRSLLKNEVFRPGYLKPKDIEKK